MLEIKSLVYKISENSNTFIADSAIGGKGQSFLSQIGIVDNKTFGEFIIKNSLYKNFQVIGQDNKWYGREIFIFS